MGGGAASGCRRAPGLDAARPGKAATASPMKNAQRLAFTTALATLVLIAIGAYVRATGSGLGCPDWPTCHGGAVPPAEKHSVIEFSHRFAASLVGLLVIATAAMAWRYYRHVPFTFWSAMIAVPLVGL